MVRIHPIITGASIEVLFSFATHQWFVGAVQFGFLVWNCHKQSKRREFIHSNLDHARKLTYRRPWSSSRQYPIFGDLIELMPSSLFMFLTTSFAWARNCVIPNVSHSGGNVYCQVACWVNILSLQICNVHCNRSMVQVLIVLVLTFIEVSQLF